MRSWLTLLLAGCTLGAQERPVLIEHVRVFDGRRVVEADSVLFRGGKIEALGRRLKAPEGAQVVEGRGCTLMPGLIDGHVHTWGEALRQAPPFGVTTVLDMFADPASLKALRASGPEAADLRSAGFLATAPGGHGTQYGVVVPTLTKPEEAQAWVDARVAEGSDFIKIVIEHGEAYGHKTPTLTPETVKAVVKAAHTRGKLAVAHISTEAEALEALEAGVDGLVHLFLDRAPSPGFLKLAKAKKVFVIPTLSVLASVVGAKAGEPLMQDPHLKPMVNLSQGSSLGQSFRIDKGTQEYRHAEATVQALEQAGVLVLAGTDAPNPGTAFGVSMHGELQRLVAAGLSPAQALAAATSRNAEAFQLKDRGRIAKGLRADLVLVQGDPTQDIQATRAVQAVWKEGRAVDLEARRRSVATEAKVAPALKEGALGARIGGETGWNPSTDQMMGGRSKAEIRPVPGESALEVVGEVVVGAPYTWAGIVRVPAPDRQPVDVTGFKQLRFRIRGEGTVNLQFFTRAGGYIPHMQPVRLEPEWRTITVPMEGLKGVDLGHLMALALVAGPTPGPVHFWVEGVAFEK